MYRKMCLSVVFAIGVALLLIVGPVQATTILVSGYAATTIDQYDGAGTYEKAFATTSAPYLVSPYGTCLGPDGYVYAAYAGSYNGSDGGILKLKADGSTPVGAGAAFGTLTYAIAVHWASDGYLYVNNKGIYRMDASGTLDTAWNGGAPLTAGSNAGFIRDITSRDNGNGTFDLFFGTTMVDNGTGPGRVFRETINKATGAITGETSYDLPTIDGAPSIPQHVQFGPDGLLYVCTSQNSEIWRANLSDATPAFTPFIPGGGTFGLGFDWDGSGGLLVTYGNDILKYNASTGDFIGYWAHGVNGAQSILAIPEPGTLVLLGTSLIGILAYAWRKRK